MDEQGGAGGMPLHDDQAQARHRKPRVDRDDDEKTAAADTDEASRLDRPQQTEKPGGKGTRWVSPRDE
ncbi:hypothetical protein MTF65_01150 [Streptomyces sp. APSN-46.1]|uniref:hypothetical protein n=1 Tax=Streptomyces sp. APSN-46.1 TaxID=2929049 RepID=UPI001FB1CD08|nr:hypothetical protein [Streptomyces sp. APSN-46.1]MCJ1675990.1 hypothetical protein [Streptomyces sp. APSN-46.1]